LQGSGQLEKLKEIIGSTVPERHMRADLFGDPNIVQRRSFGSPKTSDASEVRSAIIAVIAPPASAGFEGDRIDRDRKVTVASVAPADHRSNRHEVHRAREPNLV